MVIYVPVNKYGIRDGYYSLTTFANLIRSYRHIPDAVAFLADMLE